MFDVDLHGSFFYLLLDYDALDDEASCIAREFQLGHRHASKEEHREDDVNENVVVPHRFLLVLQFYHVRDQFALVPPP